MLRVCWLMRLDSSRGCSHQVRIDGGVVGRGGERLEGGMWVCVVSVQVKQDLQGCVPAGGCMRVPQHEVVATNSGRHVHACLIAHTVFLWLFSTLPVPPTRV